MITICPICNSTEWSLIWDRKASPLHQFLPSGRSACAEDFAPLQIVECRCCGHLYNRAFDSEVLDRMYTSDHLTNVPVSQGMLRHLEGIQRWIGPEGFEGRHVIEVGSGSGALARMMARTAAHVTLIEPSKGIGVSDFSESNIELFSEMFPPRAPLPPADLVVCRQVLEHIPCPIGMLQDIVSVMGPSGCLYLEVPNADYIWEHAALFDFHCAHVQYFVPSNLVRLAEQVGLTPLRAHFLNAGRDFGVLFSRDTRAPFLLKPEEKHGDLEVRLLRRQKAFQTFFQAKNGGIVLYGATWNGLAFLNAFDHPAPFRCVLDDNQQYVGCCLYHPHLVVPVVPSNEDVVRPEETVIITAYHHASAIEQRLRGLGFVGQILSAADTPA